MGTHFMRCSCSLGQRFNTRVNVYAAGAPYIHNQQFVDAMPDCIEATLPFQGLPQTADGATRFFHAWNACHFHEQG